MLARQKQPGRTATLQAVRGQVELASWLEEPAPESTIVCIAERRFQSVIENVLHELD
ncbi:MAG: hypothetical protein ACI9DC_005136 [Gammaproteobacteria bacterium]